MFTIITKHRLTIFLLFYGLIFPGASYTQTIVSFYRMSSLHAGVDDARSETNPCSSHNVNQPLSTCSAADEWMSQELSSLGPRGEVIARVREQTLQILQSDNACKAWFEGADPDIADVYRSLHYDIDVNGTATISGVTDKFGELLFKHPWGARSIEGSGRNSFIELNGNGPFFIRKTRVMPSIASLAAMLPDEPQSVLIGPYEGATPEAQITIMLHELGHVVGRLPRDDDSWNGKSSNNTREVLRHCKREIHQAARQDLR